MAMLEIYTIFRKIKMKKFSMTGMHKMVTIHGINETLTKKNTNSAGNHDHTVLNNTTEKTGSKLQN